MTRDFVFLRPLGPPTCSHRRGCDLGPKAIQQAGLNDVLDKKFDEIIYVDVDIHDKENENNPKLKNLESVYLTSNSSAGSVSAAIANGYFPLIIGGDHSISIGTISGVLYHYDNLGVIWVDAHGDVNTPQTTPSGNIHGMPLAIRMGFGEESLVNAWLGSPIKTQNVVILGARDLDEGEVLFLKEQNITYYTMQDLKRMGLTKVLNQINGKFKQNGVEHIHISFDMDSLDPSVVQGVGTPVENGFLYKEAVEMLTTFKEWEKVVSAEFVETNPLLDVKNHTAKVAVSLIDSLL